MRALPFVVSFIFYVVLGTSLTYNYMHSKEIEDLKVSEAMFLAHINQLSVDTDELRQGLAWWRYRCQVIANERDNARRALETVWKPTIIHKGSLRGN